MRKILLPQTMSSRRALEVQRVEAALRGAFFAYHAVEVRIDGQNFELPVDTGSDLTAVPAASSLNCPRWYRGACTGLPIGSSYGDGTWWSGRTCGPESIQLGGLVAQAEFSGMQRTGKHFLHYSDISTCAASSFGPGNSDGILGASYPMSTTFPFNESTLIDVILRQHGLPDIFSMQCCGWDGASMAPGTLVLGGISPRLHTGAIQYTPITETTYYCVQMTRPATSAPSPSCASGNAIVDSGTSKLLFAPDAYKEVMAPIVEALAQYEEQLGDSARAHKIRNGGAAYVNRRYWTADAISALPPVIIELAGGVSLSIPSTTYFQPGPHQSDYCYELGITRSDDNINTLGQVVMEAYYTVFDRANCRVGFAPIAGCPSRSTPSCAAASTVRFPPASPPPPPLSPPPPPLPNTCYVSSTTAAAQAARSPQFGTYVLMPSETCNGRSVFRKTDGTSDNYLFFSSYDSWHIGPSACGLSYDIYAPNANIRYDTIYAPNSWQAHSPADASTWSYYDGTTATTVSGGVAVDCMPLSIPPSPPTSSC